MAKKDDTNKTRIIVRSFDHKILDEAVLKIVETAKRTGAIIAGPIPLPVKKKIITVNKSTFVSKKSREQFEMRIHKRLVDLRQTTGATMEELSNLSLPAGVDIELKMVVA